MEDDCPLPRRASHEVPDIQIIAKDDPDRFVVTYKSTSSIRTDKLALLETSSATCRRHLRVVA